LDCLEFVASIWPWHDSSAMPALHRHLGTRRREDPDGVQAWILRPRLSPVSTPIRAKSEKAAVFELFYQVARGGEA